MSDTLRERVGLGQDTFNFCCGSLCFGVMVALIASAVAWPISYYHTNRNHDMMEHGYEEVVNRGGGWGQTPITVTRKVESKK